ncbi:MAG TPA: hypothetical protein ENN19_02890 [Chloroflexi bacterium]|nr:hypothetical protein [Chloroflexota bacterium]
MLNPTSDDQMNDTFSQSIEVLGLSSRAHNALMDAGIETVGDVQAALAEGDEALTRIKGIGPKTLESLKQKMTAFQPPAEAEAAEPVEAMAEPAEVPVEVPAEVLAEVPAAEPMIESEAEPEIPTPEELAAEAEIAMPSARVEPEPAPSVEREIPEVPTTAPEPAPSLIDRLRATFAQSREQIGFRQWVFGAVRFLAIILLLVPPVALPRRLGLLGYTRLNADSGYAARHEDGLTVSVSPEAEEKLRVRLESVPERDLMAGYAGKALVRAIEALPEHLSVKSPLYKIDLRGAPSRPVILDVDVPTGAEPWQTLDLYTWNGDTWEWVGSDLHAEVLDSEFIRAEVVDVPPNLVVMQAGAIAPTVATTPNAGDTLADVSINVLDTINPTGLILSANGGFVVEPSSFLQPAQEIEYAVKPVLRNWVSGVPFDPAPLADVLTTPETQQAHIANIVKLCTESGFAGVDVDYRGVGTEQREAFTTFITALADALHAEGMTLGVVVEQPVDVDGEWHAGGYDLRALGQAVDVIKIPSPTDLAAYAEGGEIQRLLDWATARVNRYKLHVLFSSLSTEKSSAGVRSITLEQALAPCGQIVAVDGVTEVEPDEQVAFSLSGSLMSITRQDIGNTYRLEYEANGGDIRTVWLGTAGCLETKLQWAQRYHLGGVTVADVLNSGNMPGVLSAVAAYKNAVDSPVSQDVAVVWTVRDGETSIDQQSTPLTNPEYTWTVAASPGDYTVHAEIAGLDHGSAPIAVRTPEPEIAEVITETETVTETFSITTTQPSNLTSDVTDDCLKASFVADVTIPDNTQMEAGEEFVKTWKLRNSGSCDWPEDTVLARVRSELGGEETVPVGAVPVGQDVEISINLVAPEEALVEGGGYDGLWALRVGETEIPNGRITAVIRIGEGGGGSAVAAPVVAPVSSGGFELGGHIRDMGFPYADKMRYAGMTWAKVQVHYGQDASGLVSAAHGRGFKIQLSGLGQPGMVTQPGFEQDVANWMAQMAAAGADAIEVWNEPNIDREWQIGHISPQAYTRLLCAAYNAIKAANPGTAVISAAPAPTGSFGGACQPNGGNCDDAPWMAGLRDAGAAQCMDYIGAHHNSGATSPSARSGHPAGGTHHSWYFLPQTELYYRTFGGARKIVYTEMGYASQEGVPPFHDAFAWARGNTNANQAAWLAEAVRISVNTGMVRCIIVWNIDFSRYGYDPQDGYAIIRPGGACPACDALHAVLGSR